MLWNKCTNEYIQLKFELLVQRENIFVGFLKSGTNYKQVMFICNKYLVKYYSFIVPFMRAAVFKMNVLKIRQRYVRQVAFMFTFAVIKQNTTVKGNTIARQKKMNNFSTNFILWVHKRKIYVLSRISKKIFM